MSETSENKRAKIKSLAATFLPLLPKQWSWATLNDLAATEPHSITDGPFGSNLKTSHYTDTGPRVIRLQNIGDGFFLDGYAHISEAHFESLKRQEIIAGDLAIAALGETLPRSCVVPTWVGPAIVKADCPRFRPNLRVVLSEFVNYALNSPDTRRRTSGIIHGVGRPRLNLAEVRGIWLPVAPLNEQRRIVAKIEELFSDLDAGVAALKRAKANLKRYRAAVLKAAVEGRLTEEWRAKHPSTELASKLLERILTERRQKWEAEQLAKFAAAEKEPPKNWREKYVEPTPPVTAGLPELPADWCWASVEQITSLVTKGSSPGWQGFEYCREGVPFVRSQNVRWGALDLDDLVFLPKAFNDTHHNSIVRSGDVLLNLVGASIGRAATATEAVEGANTNQAVGIIRLIKDSMPSRLLVHILLSPMLQSYIAKTKADVARANFNLDDVRPTPIPLPPSNEQDIVATEVAEKLSQIDAAEISIEHDLLRAARLRQSILKQAFEGKLVPQDPKDEPASVLLGRLRARRSVQEGNGKAETLARIRGRRATSKQ